MNTDDQSNCFRNFNTFDTSNYPELDEFEKRNLMTASLDAAACF